MQNNSRILTRSAFLLALAAIFPLVGLPQPLTGGAVNTVLYLAAATVSPLASLMIGCLTPWAALLRGVLPPPLLIAVPLIMLGNAVLILVFRYLRKINLLLAVLIASLSKFFLFLVTTRLVLGPLLHLPNQLIHKVTVILGIPQLVTALAGGMLACLILHMLPGKYLWENQRRYYTIR